MERRRKLKFEHNMREHISKLYFEQFFYLLISFFTKNFFLLSSNIDAIKNQLKIFCKKTNQKIEKLFKI